MDDLSSFVEGLVSHLGRAFFLAGFMPALILVAVNQYVIFSPTYTGAEAESGWNFFPELTSPWLNLFTGEMLTTIVLSLVIGLMLVVLSTFTIRLFEGLVPGVKQLLLPLYLRNLRQYRNHYAPIAARQQERASMLARQEDSGDFDEQAAFALYGDLDRMHGDLEKAQPVYQLPFLRTRVAPTAFGNVWAIMEEYPLRRYGMDGMLFWPYVREVIGQTSARLLDEIDNQKLIIDVVMNLALAAGIITLEGVVFAVLRFQWQMLVLALIALVLFIAMYQAGVGYARSLASLVTKSYDLYRLPVLDAFGLDRPKDLDEEYWAWNRLAAFLRRGEPFYFEMLDRKNGSNGSG
jgi:hypothetical protein